jgi:hypothetical protein
MKKILRKLEGIFSPKELQGLDSVELLDALNDPGIRKQWLFDIYEELKRMNLEIDVKLRSGEGFYFNDLCARRKAFQDVLDTVLSAKRQVRSHNPADKSAYDFDAVTA